MTTEDYYSTAAFGGMTALLTAHGIATYDSHGQCVQSFLTPDRKLHWLGFSTGLGDLDPWLPHTPSFGGSRLTHIVWLNRPDFSKPECPRKHFVVDYPELDLFFCTQGQPLLNAFKGGHSVDVVIRY